MAECRGKLVALRAICDFEVIDESDDWIVVSKPAPLVVHPANGSVEPTLLGGLEILLSSELAGGGGLSILTRLDRETSGLVLVAKNRKAAKLLADQLMERTAEKVYLAIVHGWPAWEEVLMDQPILRAGSVGHSPIWLRQKVHPDGKASKTRLRLVEKRCAGDTRISVIECRPETGRTHQIRVHLEHAGFPLVGDKIYGTDGSAYLAQIADGLTPDMESRLLLPRHALHALRLSVGWAGDRVSWESPLPHDLTRFLEDSDLAEAHG